MLTLQFFPSKFIFLLMSNKYNITFLLELTLRYRVLFVPMINIQVSDLLGYYAI